MILGFSAYKAALYGILSIVIIMFAEKRGRIDWRALVRTLARGGRNAVLIAVTCAAAGIVIGVSNETGIGVKFASIIISLGHNNLYLILPMVMLASIVLGMGLPTSACYIMVAAIAVPALIKMGCNTMASHMFALYFGVFSGITPPVAISAYAAAGLAKSPPMKTGWLAVGLSLPAFIIPYSFIFNPSLILEGTIAKHGMGDFPVHSGYLRHGFRRYRLRVQTGRRMGAHSARCALRVHGGVPERHRLRGLHGHCRRPAHHEQDPRQGLDGA